jgi:hypothetical protein
MDEALATCGAILIVFAIIGVMGIVIGVVTARQMFGPLDD